MQAALEGLGAGLGDRLAAADRAGEGDTVDALVADQVFADLDGAGHALHQALGQVIETLHHDERGKARDLGRLQDHRVAGAECRTGLPAEQHEGEVERQDDADHAQGMFGHDVELAVDHGADDAAVFVAGDLGIIVEGGRRPLHFVGGLLVRLAHFAGQRLGQFGAQLAKLVRHLVQFLAAFQHVHTVPHLLGAFGVGDCFVDLLDLGERNLAVDVLGRRIDGVDAVGRPAFAERAVQIDRAAELFEGFDDGHGLLPVRCPRDGRFVGLAAPDDRRRATA